MKSSFKTLKFLAILNLLMPVGMNLALATPGKGCSPEQKLQTYQITQQVSQFLSNIDPKITNNTPYIYKENDADFKIDLQKLQDNNMQIHSEMMSPEEFTALSIAPLDFHKINALDNTKMIVTKMAAIINGKSPADFKPEDTYLNPAFLEYTNPGDRYTKSEVSPYIFTAAKPKSFFTKAFTTTAEIFTANLKEKTGRISQDKLETIAKFNTDLGATPDFIIASESLNETPYSNSAHSFHQFFPLKGNNSLIVTYQFASAKQSELGPKMFRGAVMKKVESAARDELQDYVQKLRTFKK